MAKNGRKPKAETVAKRRVGRPSRGLTKQLVTRLSKDLSDALDDLRRQSKLTETRTRIVDRLLRKGLGWEK